MQESQQQLLTEFKTLAENVTVCILRSLCYPYIFIVFLFLWGINLLMITLLSAIPIQLMTRHLNNIKMYIFVMQGGCAENVNNFQKKNRTIVY